MDDAQRARFEAAFQSAWVDKVTKRKRTHETQAGLRLVRDKAIAFLMLYAGPRVEEVERLILRMSIYNPNRGYCTFVRARASGSGMSRYRSRPESPWKPG